MPAPPADGGSAVLESGRPAARAGSNPTRPTPAAKPEGRPSRSGGKKPPGDAVKSTDAAAVPPAPAGDAPPREGWWMRVMGMYGLSIAVHVLAAVVLTFVALPVDAREKIFSILGEAGEPVEDAPIFEAVEIPEELTDEQTDSLVEEVSAENMAEVAVETPLDVNDLDPSVLMPQVDVGAALNLDTSNPTAGRSTGAKSMMVEKYGGSAASEQAVAGGLKWLASIQRKDGSWNFDDLGGAPDAGSVDSPTGATACALLAFLGAGHTHTEDGPYKRNVQIALNYLLERGVMTAAGGDFRGGYEQQGMYVQGIVGIALAEAHGMTKDRRLRRAAESCATFIVNAQGPLGGWRYKPGQVGDTSAVGWQVMALKSTQAANIKIPPQTFKGVMNFLDAASADGGARYRYLPPGDGREETNPRPSLDAVGLLCRMYLGWDSDNPALKKGVALLAKRGPDRNNMYYNYYATQILHHWGGKEWTSWNGVMRDQLVETQVRGGAYAGSWNPAGGHTGEKGGRLFDTCLSIMTLEVYYRHLPLYERGGIQVEF